MIKYIGKRLLALIPVLLVVSVVIFLLIHLVPGDPAAAILGEQATPERVEALRQELGAGPKPDEDYKTKYGFLF